MTLSIDRFGEFFGALYYGAQAEPLTPFPWQKRLAKQVYEGTWPECIDLPTASGKTACIDIAVFVLACQADRPANDRAVGRRIFFTVNRRVIVDAAFDRARSLAQKLLDAKDGILKEVADALRVISGDRNAPPLDVAQLRGGIYRERAWARSITQPIVVCTTADQLGSRLLFRGYGVSQSMQPVHAALTACDSLILLDEAHVTRAFCQTMRLLTKYQRLRTGTDKVIPSMRFVQMTATPVDVSDRFELDASDLSHPVIEARQTASKPAELIKLDNKKSFTSEVTCRAIDALSPTRKAVGIIVNRVQAARDIEASLRAKLIEEKIDAVVHLIIGRMRPIDRDDLQAKLRDIVGPSRPEVFPAKAKSVFVVATQCLEVGADYDFDVLITECASIDALRQRFGRLNRRGRPIEATAAIVTTDESIEGDDPIYGDAIKHTWEWLTANNRNSINFSIAEFKKHWDDLDLGESKRQAMLAPAPDAAVLLPAHLDALCQTNPQPVPSPEVSFFIHGPQRDNAEVSVCWRADLGNDDSCWPDIVRLLPPSSPECMTVPLRDLRRWMLDIPLKEKDDRDADVPVASDPDTSKPDLRDERSARRVVVWRGSKTCDVARTPRDVSPGDTLVICVEDLIADIEREPQHRSPLLGHIPGLPTRNSLKRDDAENDAEYKLRRRMAHAVLDLAERAARESRRRLVVRLHNAFPEYAGLRALTSLSLRAALEPIFEARFHSDDEIERRERTSVLSVLSAPLDPHLYPDADTDEGTDAKLNRVIVFKRLLDPSNTLVVSPNDGDDGDDGLSECDHFLALDAHTRHVVEQVDAALDTLGVDGLASTLRDAARLHDFGKADLRFQAMLGGVTPYEAMMRPVLFGKGDGKRLTAEERNAIRTRSLLPEGFRHEMLSVEIVRDRYNELVKDGEIGRDLLLHLIASHHGYGRPFAPVVIDDATDDVLSIEVNQIVVRPEQRTGADWIPSHRLDSGVAERFWSLTRTQGWWGLAWLESILRLADQQASAAEQDVQTKGNQRD
ncbi:MAG: type I-U CRISPR-associated helicase/endonuclease Cas3 [Phycisphaerae bacterium]|nr:type I-U CRISPR-associated helicase/endonuclease Cas3 [Phycisphaerae bacterium]